MEWNTLFPSFSTQKPVWWFSLFLCLKVFFGIRLHFKIVWSAGSWVVLPLLPLCSFPPLDIFRHVLSSPWKSLPSLSLHLANSHSLSRFITKITPIRKWNFPYNPSFFSLFLIHRIFYSFIIMCFFVWLFCLTLMAPLDCKFRDS